MEKRSPLPKPLVAGGSLGGRHAPGAFGGTAGEVAGKTYGFLVISLVVISLAFYRVIGGFWFLVVLYGVYKGFQGVLYLVCEHLGNGLYGVLPKGKHGIA